MTAQTGTLYWLGVLLPDAELDPTECLLMIGLADHVDAEDECYVGIDTLATYARVSYGTARRRLTQLANKGRVERTRRRRSDGNLSTYTWRLVRPEPAPILRDDQRAPGGAVTSAQPDARAEVPSDEPPSDEPTTRAREDAVLLAGFERFWSAYPRATAKGSARDAWPKAVRAAGGMGLIIDGAVRFAADPNRDDRFTPHASTWLRAERWADPPLPPRTDRPKRATVGPMDTDRDAPAGRLDL